MVVGGYRMVTGWLWVVMRWPRGDHGVVLGVITGWLRDDYGVVTGWLRDGYGVVVGGYRMVTG